MGKGGWKILAVLGAAQFLMVLDQAVMNVSISQLVEDFDKALKTGLLVAALLSFVAFLAAGNLPARAGPRRTEPAQEELVAA